MLAYLVCHGDADLAYRYLKSKILTVFHNVSSYWWMVAYYVRRKLICESISLDTSIGYASLSFGGFFQLQDLAE